MADNLKALLAKTLEPHGAAVATPVSFGVPPPSAPTREAKTAFKHCLTRIGRASVGGITPLLFFRPVAPV